MTLLAVILSYLIGSIPFGYLIVQLKKGLDVRSVGSGNTGATNVMRAAGRSGAVLTLILDVAKGYSAVFFASLLMQNEARGIALSALAAILGHVLPIYLRFKGGKGVATGVGIFLYLSTIPILIALVVFLIVVGLSRYVSLGSMLGAASFPIFYYLLDYSRRPLPWILFAACFCSGLIIITHYENIRRLMAGTERKLAGGK